MREALGLIPAPKKKRQKNKQTNKKDLDEKVSNADEKFRK
jgi:hypothetical protein